MLIVGALATGVVEIIKRWFGTGTLANKLITVAVCLVLASVAWFLMKTEYWETVIGVMGVASFIYGMSKQPMTTQ